jgi:tetratricopeptide (TPR) repeat protein
MTMHFFKPAFMVVVLLLALPAPSLANTAAGNTSRTEVQNAFQKAFWAMLADPSDTEKTIRYAELAVKLGDYEAAIPPLERLLMLNPGLPKVRLEVGVLYYLLNSREVARGYLNDVKNDPQAAPELVKRAEDYLARL